jgi:hypothetical protein
MRERYLEVSYKRGKPLAAYLHLPHPPGAKSARTQRWSDELLVDFAADGTPLGVEILSPSTLTVGEVNAIMRSLGLALIDDRDLAPLAA